MALMLAPLPNETFVTSSGNVYLSQSNGIINNVATQQDVTDLQSAGCKVISPWPPDLLFYGKGFNFNSTADQELNQTAWTGKFRPSLITVTNASISLTTAAGGFYTGPNKTGTMLVASGQSYSSLSAALLALDCALAGPATVLASGTPIYLSLTTAQGTAASADIYVYGRVYN
jgi:hypothetical protein